ERMLAQAEGVAENRDLRGLGPARERGGHHHWRGHQPIGVLVMLVDGNAGEAELGGKLELVEIAVVELVPLLRIEIAVRPDHPGGAILVAEVHVQIGIGHEMKHEHFHRRLPHVVLATHDCTWLGMSYQRRRRVRSRRLGARGTVDSHSSCNGSRTGFAIETLFAGHPAGPTADPLASSGYGTPP